MHTSSDIKSYMGASDILPTTFADHTPSKPTTPRSTTAKHHDSKTMSPSRASISTTASERTLLPTSASEKSSSSSRPWSKTKRFLSTLGGLPHQASSPSSRAPPSPPTLRQSDAEKGVRGLDPAGPVAFPGTNFGSYGHSRI